MTFVATHGYAESGALLSLALLGMGTAIGLADEMRPFMIAGALLAIAITMVFRRRGAWLAVGTSLVLAGLILSASGDLTSTWLDSVLYAVCLLIFVGVGHYLVAEVEDSLTLSELGVAPAGAQGARRLEPLARVELSRARRAERPLSVAILAVNSALRRRDLGDAARALARALRCTDVIGYAGRNQLCVLFVETGHQAAIDALKRLQRELEPAIAGRLSVGIASFPEDNTTWNGLRAIALEHQRPLAEVELAGRAPLGELHLPSGAAASPERHA